MSDSEEDGRAKVQRKRSQRSYSDRPGRDDDGQRRRPRSPRQEAYSTQTRRRRVDSTDEDQRDKSSSPRRRRERERERDREREPKRKTRRDSRDRSSRDDGEEYRYREGRSGDSRRRNRSRSSSPGRSRRSEDGEKKRDHKRYRDRSRDRTRDRDHRRNRSSHSPREQGLSSSRSSKPLPSQNDAFTSLSKRSGHNDNDNDEPVVEKQKPNFGLSGRLAAASNTVQTANQTIVLKYHEPPEARKPPSREPWRLYVFKNDEILDTVELAEQSCWLFGREVAVADFPIEHESCSKQHAVMQFRYVERRNEFGDTIGKVKPYIIDLESSNGTSVNGEQIPAAKYVELRDKDMVQFGHSTREYVVQLPGKPTTGAGQ